MRSPTSSSTPSTEPITTPAICPPESSRRWLALAAETPVAVELRAPVEDGNRGGIGDVDGRVTPVHRWVTLDAAQHESVALGELDEQYPQSPRRFAENPQLYGSFPSPVMHCWVRELLGRAQFVKSARIWFK